VGWVRWCGLGGVFLVVCMLSVLFFYGAAVRSIILIEAGRRGRRIIGGRPVAVTCGCCTLPDGARLITFANRISARAPRGIEDDRD